MSMLTVIALQEAMHTAKIEAEKTPIAVGELVGQVYGVLLSYDGSEAVINNPVSGETFRLPTAGLVDIKRVYALAAIYMKRLQSLVDVIDVMSMLGVPPKETLASLLDSQGAGPTPGCTSQEDRDAAVARGGKPEDKTFAAGAGGDQQLEDLLAQLKTATDKLN
jgi:hypothetical protein